MKQIKFSLLIVIAMGCIAFAGGGYSPVVEPVVEVPEIDGTKASGPYLGIGLSAVITYEDDSSFFDHEEGQDRTGDFTFIAGYDFNKNVALEGRYMISFTHEDRIERDSWGIYLKPQYPIMEELNVYGLLGYGNFQLEGVNGNNIDIDESGFQWGVGMSYDVTDKISLFADYMKLANDVSTDGFVTFPADISSDAITIGVIYKF